MKHVVFIFIIEKYALDESQVEFKIPRGRHRVIKFTFFPAVDVTLSKGIDRLTVLGKYSDKILLQ